jgi:hypothetical protein
VKNRQIGPIFTKTVSIYQSLDAFGLILIDALSYGCAEDVKDLQAIKEGIENI